MRFNLLTLVLAVIVVLTANAQKFSPGYYITSSGDTVRKDISLQRNKALIEKIVTPEGLFLAPKDVLGFGQNGVNYIVRTVSMDKTPRGGFVTDTVFLEVMSRGKMSLLYMEDEAEKAHYYIENENGPQELTVRLNAQNDGIVVRRVETFKSALKGIFPTCTDLFPSIDKTLFSKKGIQSIYEKLYKCRYQEAAPAVTTAVEKGGMTDFGVSAGAGTVSHKMSYFGPSGNDTHYVLTRLKFKPTIAPTLAIYFETKFNRIRRFSLRQELSYFQYKSTSNEKRKDPYSDDYYTGTLGASHLRYSLGVRAYLTNERAVRPFLSGAISPQFLLSTKQQMMIEDRKKSEVEYKTIFRDQDVQKVSLGYFLGAGVTYKQFAFEIRREIVRGFNDPGLVGADVQWTITSYSFNLNYTLKTLGKK